MLYFIAGKTQTKQQRQHDAVVRAQRLLKANIVPKFIKPIALLAASIASYAYVPSLPGMLMAIAGVSAALVFVRREHANVKAYQEYVIKLEDEVRKLGGHELRDFVKGTEADMSVCPEVPFMHRSKAYLAGYEAQSVHDITLIDRVSCEQNRRYR